MASCNCIGGNPCPCQLRRMAYLGFFTIAPPVYPYQQPDSSRVYSWTPPHPATVPAMRADDV